MAKRNSFSFYQKYVSHDNINHIAIIGKKTTNTLLLAIECNDEDSVLYLLNLGAKIDDRAIATAIVGNHAKVLQRLIQDESINHITINRSIIMAIEEGRIEAFNALMTHDQFNTQFKNTFLNSNKARLIQGCPIKNDVYLGTDVKILH